ncbi:MAG: hypothetical protein WA655_11920 [Candidatus Korobacteraceae bacterium]
MGVSVAQPLSNLDYLIGAVKRSDEPPARQRGGDVPNPAPPTAMQQAAAAFGGSILLALQKAGGKLDAFELVEATGIPLETLFHVLDTLSSEFQWVTVDKSDPKGNYKVELRQEARDYMKRAGLL